MRINRALSRAGVCSRREADRLIDQGRILVDGVVPEKGSVVALNAKISLARGGSVSRISLAPLARKPKLWMHNKQRGLVFVFRVARWFTRFKGVLVSASDPEGRVCLIPELCRQLDVEHLIPIGRLDFTSEGLILLTDDGGLADRLMRSSIPRYYTLRLRGSIDQKKLDELANGITVRGINYKPLTAKLAGPQTGSNAWVNVTIRGMSWFLGGFFCFLTFLL